MCYFLHSNIINIKQEIHPWLPSRLWPSWSVSHILNGVCQAKCIEFPKFGQRWNSTDMSSLTRLTWSWNIVQHHSNRLNHSSWLNMMPENSPSCWNECDLWPSLWYFEWLVMSFPQWKALKLWCYQCMYNSLARICFIFQLSL